LARARLAAFVMTTPLSGQAAAPRPEEVGSLDGLIRAFYEVVSGPIHQHGINSIQCYWDGTRWWILGWVYDSERAGNPIPAEYLPAAPR
jgi:hypothetical protein